MGTGLLCLSLLLPLHPSAISRPVVHPTHCQGIQGQQQRPETMEQQHTVPDPSQQQVQCAEFLVELDDVHEKINDVNNDNVMDNANSSIVSDINQFDGAHTVSEVSVTESLNSSLSEFESENEVDSDPVPVVLVPATVQPAAGQPLVLEVDTTGQLSLPASIPLGMVTNARSLYNKEDSLVRFLREIGPDFVLVSETWEYEGRRRTLEQMLAGTNYNVFSYRRPRKPNGDIHSGGCCAIIFNQSKFNVEKLDVDIEEGIECVYAIFIV